MNPPAASLTAGRSRWHNWIYAGLLALMAALALTNHSFWIDETYSARLAQQPTPAACWHLLREVKGSDPQMPLYIFWLWTCEKFTGSREFALRALNLFWFIPALVVLLRAVAGNRTLQGAVFIVALGSPFAWYYLNEARAYTMQFSTSLILFAILWHWTREKNLRLDCERGWALIFCAAFFCLCGSSLLSMALATTPVLMALILLPADRLGRFVKIFWRLWASLLAFLFLLGIYYLWTLHSGDRATGIAGTNWKNPLFIAYELLGFAGLGPGRLAIRGGTGMEVFKPYAPALLLYAAVIAALLWLALGELRQKLGSKKLAMLIIAVLLPAGLVLAASAHSHFRILGRHLATLLPVAILLTGYGLAAAWRRGPAGRMLAGGFICLYLSSALSLRFAARHDKDDYRTAAAIARVALAERKIVWWSADTSAAFYYELPLAVQGVAETGRALWLAHPGLITVAGAARPDVIIASRPDVYDERGIIPEFARRENYQLNTNVTAFQIWKRELNDRPAAQVK